MRVNFIRRNLLQAGQSQSQTFSQLEALDVGCGAGILSESLARLGLGSVTGIDPTDKCVRLAEEHLAQASSELAARLRYRNTSLEEVAEEGKEYDLVCCSEVVEHVDAQAEFMRKCLKLVKPETGRLFVSTIAKTPESYLLTIVCKGRISQWC